MATAMVQDGEIAELVQNINPQTNGWLHDDYIHVLHAVYGPNMFVLRLRFPQVLTIRHRDMIQDSGQVRSYWSWCQ